MDDETPETIDGQAVAIGLGTLVAVGCFAYGVLVSRTLFGVDTTTLASWAVAATVVVVAGLHAVAGRSDLALAYATAGCGWMLVLVGSSSGLVLVGLIVLAGSGAYIARTSLRARSHRSVSGSE